ncbi:glycoside hydrolase family 2 protein [Cubamyces lactineus]|nr:glycoside hydrolase family 2 protein [Cubamyces lactineus]
MLLPLLSLASVVALSAAEILSLSQLNWTVQNQEGLIKAPARVPSQVHLDLKDANVITEPLLGINDFTERWIVTDPAWIYTADLTPVLNDYTQGPNTSRALLVFYGLDTVATITVAGHPVAWVNNQFQEYVYDVSEYLASPLHNDTTLTVSFESAYLYGLNVSSRPDVESQIAIDFEWPGVREFIRKISSDFGWDWGPAFAPSGIFKPAYLVTLSEEVNGTALDSNPAAHPLLLSNTGGLFIEESSLEISKDGQTPNARPNESADWVVNVTLALRSMHADPNPTLTVSVPELNITSGPLSLAPIPAASNASTFASATFTIPSDVPQRWYPHNLGTPKLYNFTVTLSIAGLPPAYYSTRSGFRTVYLAQMPYSQEDVEQRGITPGDQWHFEVNGKTIYSMGSNVIPFDPFYARISTDKVRWILESVVQSGQNMLRVWGGGIYQPSDELTGGYDFYSICDELGILVWSELGFSDASYPVNDFFLESIEREVRQNVRRVKKHPSNVQWAGGNEIEPALLLVNNTIGTLLPARYIDDFLLLFQDFLHDIVMQEQTTVAYTDCSTTNGVLSLDPYLLRLNNLTEGYIYGNAELYNYDTSQAFNYSTYPKARFVNEFGFHSMPSFYSWEEVLQSPEDFNFNSTVVMSRDHHPPALGLLWPNPLAPVGQGEMTVAVEQWLPTPYTSDSNQTFAQWCYSTQVFQSMYMMSEIAYYRRGSGRGENNLGALVWQLNDIWQGVSWSAIEYSGRWKVMQYGLSNIYSPVMIYPFWTPESETLEVAVTSDRWDTVTGTAQLTWYDWSGRALNTSSLAFSVPSLNSTTVFEAHGLDSILPAGSKAEDVWMHLNVTATADGQTVVHEQYFVPVSLANANLVDPQIKMTPGPDMTFTLSAQGGVAPFTWLDHPSGTVGYFADSTTGKPLNGFYLVPGMDRTVQFVQSSELSTVADPSPADFVVRSLWNNTHI